MSQSFFRLNRLRVMRRGVAVYDEKFHLGLNIIRGENGTGKSTISDFIFFAMGGEFDSWKGAARRCDEVQAEISTANGILTVRRTLESKTSTPSIFFGSMDDAQVHALDSWRKYPLHRSDKQESFSQIVFRAAAIPESQSEGSSNVTMHQILRLLYSDQRTPAPRLFRFEVFDTREIREAVGNLICGRNIYESYSLQLELRTLNKSFTEKSHALNLKVASFPAEEVSANEDGLASRIRQAQGEIDALRVEIDHVDDVLVDATQTKIFVRDRKQASQKLASIRHQLTELEQKKERWLI